MRRDGRDVVDLTKVEKRGDWYRVEGVVAGKRESVEIPAPSVEGRSRQDAEGLFRRSIYGTVINGGRA
jgi:hypothetical protein